MISDTDNLNQKQSMLIKRRIIEGLLQQNIFSNFL